jgi:hypothetical protein
MAENPHVYVWFLGLEERVADIYFLFRQKFTADVRLARFWTEAALEKLQHGSILRFCCEHGLFGSVEIDPTESKQLEEMLEEVSALALGADLTIDLTFHAALLIESSGIEKIFRRLIQALGASHFVLYTAIEASLRTHHEAFAQTATEFVDDRRLANAFRRLSDYPRVVA